jgi:2-polyprenyl-3-methyl-5-hydroxy-6-metoxy-1,4-benzoquinol methylase
VGLWEKTREWAAGSETVRRWRNRRYDLFVQLCGVRPDEQILDVGAGAGAALERFNSTNPIVAVDIAPQKGGTWLDRPNVSVEFADGTALPYVDGEFAIVFSSSVIEHVPKELRSAFAAEVRRVGQRYFVQTPNRYFPIEPHYQLPFFQFLPKPAQRWLNRKFTLGWQEKGRWEDIELLSARDLLRLFPDSVIHRERIFGLTKSLMAVRR